MIVGYLSHGAPPRRSARENRLRPEEKGETVTAKWAVRVVDRGLNLTLPVYLD